MTPLDPEERERLLSTWARTMGSGTDPDATVRPPDDATVGAPSTALAVPPPAPGTPSGHPGFALIDKLGQGGMGVVFRAEQRALRREVAFKRPLDGRAAAAGQFLSEALVTGFLEHPNIDPDALWRIGCWYQDLGAPALALEALERSVQLDPDGRWVPAVPRAERLLRLHAQRADAARGDPAAVIRLLKVLDREPATPSAHLGRAYLRRLFEGPARTQ